MAGLRKDVELIFRGEDRASPTIKAVRKSVSDLSGAINEQITAAARGEGSIDELAKSYRGLKDAQGDVGEIVKIAAAYENVSNKLSEQSKKVEDARAKEAALAAQIASSAKVTKTLQNSRDSAERKLNAAIQAEERYKAELLQIGAALDAAGGDSKNFAATQDRIRQAAIETARAIRDAAAAMDAFKGAQAKGQANIAAVDETKQFNAMAAGSGLPQAQIAFISTLENRLEALGVAIKADQASMAALNAELADRNAAAAADRVRGMATALNEAEAAAERLKATTAFKTMAADVSAGARDISRFGATLDTNAVAAKRFSATIEGILNPTQAAAANMNTLGAIVDKAEASFAGGKARLSDYNTELNNLGAASAGISNMARLIDQFQQQETVVNGARAAMEAAQGDVLRLASAMQTAAAPTQEMANELQRAQGNLESTGAAFAKETSKLNSFDNALEAAGIDARQLEVAQNALAASANRVAAAQAKASNITRGKGRFLGLNPQEMTQLGYQINDIVVSLISGQKPLVVFAQQGAQIGQIPGLLGRVASYAGPIALLGTAFIVVASAINKARKEADDLARGGSIVAQMGDGTAVTAEQFAALGKSLEEAGLKADDVRGKLVQLAADGLNTDQMQAYVETATALAEVTGVDVKDALETVRSSFQGGMEDIIKLDDEQNIYNQTQLDTIQSLFDQGKADEARTLALSIYQGRMEGVAAAQRGPWRVAVNELSAAWQNFLGWIGSDDVFVKARQHLTDIARGAAFTAALLHELSNGNFNWDSAVGNAAKKAMGIGIPTGAPAKGAGADPNRKTNAGQKQLREDREALAIAEARTPAEKRAAAAIKERSDAANEAAAAGLSSAEATEHINLRMAAFNAAEDAKDQKRDAAAGKRKDAAARKAEAAARAAARRSEAEANRIKSMEEGIQRQVEGLDSKVGRKSDDVAAKLDAIDKTYAKLFRDIDEYAKKTGGKGLIDGKTIAETKAHIELQKTELKNATVLKDYEEKISALESEREEKLKNIKDQVARGIITPEDGLTQSNAVIDDMAGKINGMAIAAIAFAASIKGAKLSPEMQALLAKFATQAQNNSGSQNVQAKQDNIKENIAPQEQQLNNILSARNDLVQNENALVALGVQTRQQAEQNIQAAYANSRKAILDQIAAIRAMAATYGTNLTPAMQTYFQALEARLKLAGTQVDYTSESFNNLRSHMNDILTSNIVGFIDGVAQAFARLATGQEGVMGFLEEVGRAFLTMIANILQTVATLIIEALVLSAVDKATGGILKPLLQMTAAVATIHHEGGIAGEVGGRSRSVSPLAFAGAPRYHSGGIAGLQPNETTAILKKGEEVLTEDDPRHRANGGLTPQGGTQTGIRQVLAIGDDEIAGAMSGAAGETTVLTHIRRNQATIKQMLGVGNK